MRGTEHDIGNGRVVRVSRCSRGRSGHSAEGPNCKPYSKSIDVGSDIRHYIYLEFNGTNLSGYVSNILDGPIQGATVSIGTLSDQTDQGGHYEISNVPLRSDSIIVTHARYYSTRSFLSSAGPDAHLDFSMQRDTIISGRITAAQYVDEAQPNLTPLNTRLMLTSNGYIGSIYYGNIRRHIYLNFDFPAVMKDLRVIMLDGNLELCSDGPYAVLGYEVFSLTSQWIDYSLTFFQQPTFGSNLPATPASSITGAQYVTVLSGAAMHQLLANYRTNGLIYGVVIQANSTTGYSGSQNFYSMRSTINRPRVSFKVRF